MVLTLLTIAWTVFVIRVHNCASAWAPPPAWTKRLLCRTTKVPRATTSGWNNHRLCCKQEVQRNRNQLQTYDARRDNDVIEIGVRSDVGPRAGPKEVDKASKEGRGLINDESSEPYRKPEAVEMSLTKEQILNQWKEFTMTADRMFAAFYFFGTLIGLLIMLVLAHV